MAIPIPEVEDILATLAEGSFGWAAAQGRAAIDALPEGSRRTPGAELEALNAQLAALDAAVVRPVQAELGAARRLGPFAERLGLLTNVEVVIGDSDRPSGRIVLNSEGRLDAIEGFVAAMERVMGQAREQATTRRGRRP